MKVAILTDVVEPLGAEARAPAVIAGYEIVTAMAESAARVGRLSIDVVARRGTSIDVPLISLEPDELGAWPADAAAQQSFQDALYCQLVLARLLDGYDLVHCVTPVVTPLQLLAAAGVPLVLTVAWSASESAATLPFRLIAPSRLVVATVGGTALPLELGATPVPLSVDLAVYTPRPKVKRRPVLWLGSGGDSGLQSARDAAERLSVPLEAHDGGCQPGVLQRARSLLLPAAAPSVLDHVWAARATACGTPVVGCLDAGLEDVLDDPVVGALSRPGDAAELAAAVAACDIGWHAQRERRDRALALHGRSAMASRYRRLYDRALEQRPAS